MLASVGFAFAQEPEGPQISAPAPIALAPRPVVERRGGTNDRVTVPAGTRVAVVLENGISTRSAKAGDSLYFRTSFPITQNNRVIIPVGSYLRGELLESKRPGRVKGRGEFRMRLNTLILPDGATVATTTVTGAGIGAIAAGAKGAGIGAGIGGLAGLGAVLLTRGPEAQLPRGSTLDIVLEHALALDADQIQYKTVGDSSPITPPPARPE
jgi:type IV secretion system protein VirB10